MLILEIHHRSYVAMPWIYVSPTYILFHPPVIFCLPFFSMCFLGCFFSSDTESAHDEKTDKPEKKPVKISTFFSSLLKGNKADADVEMAENKVSSAALYWVIFLT